jgi:hypothetical protein
MAAGLINVSALQTLDVEKCVRRDLSVTESISVLGDKGMHGFLRDGVFFVFSEGNSKLFPIDETWKDATGWFITVSAVSVLLHDCEEAECIHDKTPRIVVGKHASGCHSLPSLAVNAEDSYEWGMFYKSNEFQDALHLAARRCIYSFQPELYKLDEKDLDMIALMEIRSSVDRPMHTHDLEAVFVRVSSTSLSWESFHALEDGNKFMTLEEAKSPHSLFTDRHVKLFADMKIDNDGKVSWN